MGSRYRDKKLRITINCPCYWYYGWKTVPPNSRKTFVLTNRTIQLTIVLLYWWHHIDIEDESNKSPAVINYWLFIIVRKIEWVHCKMSYDTLILSIQANPKTDFIALEITSSRQKWKSLKIRDITRLNCRLLGNLRSIFGQSTWIYWTLHN